MAELWEETSKDVYSGRWRSQLEAAVRQGEGEACLMLLQMVGLVLEPC